MRVRSLRGEYGRFTCSVAERAAETVLRKLVMVQPARSVRDSVFSQDKATGTVTLFDGTYRSSTSSGNDIFYTFTMNASDVAADLRSIRDAKQSSDFAIATIHAHEPGNYEIAPSDFLLILAHKAIDAGADILIGHGPHLFREIEIHKSKPIFYSLGKFLFMYNDLHPRIRDEYESSHSDLDAAIESEYLER